jgi:hypothetical protein
MAGQLHRAGVMPVTTLAERKNASAAAMSRVSLSITSTSCALWTGWGQKVVAP